MLDNQLPYKVKLTPYRKGAGEIMFRQTAGGKGLSADGRYQFFIDDGIADPDFWVVQGKGLRHEVSCQVAPENTILLTTEPRSVLVYPQRYINQFGLVCSCQENVKHPNLVLGPPVLPWFVGYTERDGKYSVRLSYDDLIDSPTPKKTKLLSVITSNKAFTKGHLERIRFVERLKGYYGDQIDIFGRGFNSFDDKWDVLAPYKYHIVIENSSQLYYWTEKISDCFLAETFPFYYGCTNLSDYFSPEAFQYIDIHNTEGAIGIINNAMERNIYEERVSALHEAKNLVLGEYNMFDYIASLCDRLNPTLEKCQTTIRPCRTMLNWSNFYNYNISRNLFKFKQAIGKKPLMAGDKDGKI